MTDDSISSCWVAAPAATPPRSTARRPGMNIAMVEEQRVGGTCLHRGCIPAKELLQTAEVLPHRRQRGRVRRADVGTRARHVGDRRSASSRSIDRLTSGPRVAAEGTQGHGRPRHGHARARRSHGARLRRHRAARHATSCIATGSSPRALPIAGLRVRRHDASCRPTTCWSSTEVPDAGRGRSAAARSGASSRRSSSTPAPRSRSSRRCRRSSPASTSRSRRRSCARSRSAASRSQTGVQGRAASTAGGDLTFVHGQERRGAARRRRRRGVRRPPAAQREHRARGRGRQGRRARFVAVDGNLRTIVDGVYAVGDVVATPQLAHVAFCGGDRRDQDDARRGPAAASTTTRCRGASTAIPKVGVLRAHRGAGEGARVRRRDLGAPLDGQRPRARSSARPTAW